jgi:hypothetical protein
VGGKPGAPNAIFPEESASAPREWRLLRPRRQSGCFGKEIFLARAGIRTPDLPVRNLSLNINFIEPYTSHDVLKLIPDAFRNCRSRLGICLHTDSPCFQLFVMKRTTG